jgi:hypothetical protein
MPTILSLLLLFVCDRSDPTLDFIAVYNATKEITYSISLLERRGAEEYLSEEPLGEVAARDIQSTRSSMFIEGKMLLGKFKKSIYSKCYIYVISFIYNWLTYNVPAFQSCCVGPSRRSAVISKIPRSRFHGLYSEYHEGKTSIIPHVL